MKVLYAIQGTGNGHISRAREIFPVLQEYCHCDILISGNQCDIMPGFPIKFRFNGLNFRFGKNGGIDLWNTTLHANLKGLKDEIAQLKVEEYDFVINDFEPVSAWACYRKKVPCISLSHQVSLLSNNVPLPDKTDLFGRFILKNYAPSSFSFGFHFQKYDNNIFTPVIRKQIRESEVEELDYYTVYLPAYDDHKLVKKLSKFSGINWHVFSKHSDEIYQINNVTIRPISNDIFVDDLARSKGVLCGAGFETPAEALYLNKKLMVIPMKGQYEQQCNAEALKQMGVPVIKNLKKKQLPKIETWINSDEKVDVYYPDQTRMIIRKIFEMSIKKIFQEKSWEKSFRLKYRLSEYQYLLF